MPFLGSTISPSKWPRHLSSSHFSFWAILILPQLWHLAERSHILSLHRWNCLTPGCPLYKLHPPTIYWCVAPVQEPDPSGAAQVCSRRTKSLWIDCSIAQSTYCYSHPNHKKQFGVGMPPWILIIERFLGHTRFISGKQGPSSDFQYTVVQKYPSLKLYDFL